MIGHERELLEWLTHERFRMSSRLADYEAGRRKIARVENGQPVDDSEQEIDLLKQRIARIGILIAGF